MIHDAEAPVIANASTLLEHGMVELRALALRIAAAAIAASDPARATAAAVTVDDGRLRIGEHVVALDDVDRIVVLGAGKASGRIAQALERALGDRLAGGAVVVRSDAALGHPPTGADAARSDPALELERIEVLRADHPLPSEASVAAARRLAAWAQEVGERDLVLGCFTGGSSALAALPPDGVTLDDKRALTRLLLSSGLPITDVNLVRRHVSSIKGGRLAHAIAPARLINLTVSDVAGDHLEAITDPTVVDPSTPADAVAVLRESGLWPDVPPALRAHLERAAPPPAIHEPPTVMLANGASACEAMAREAAREGLPAHVLSTALEGESRELGRFVAQLAAASAETGSPFPAPCVLLGAGGETTVSLAASPARFGAGGPNQEVALAAALQLAERHPVAAAFVDSDGADGGTRLAGGIVDGLTVSRAAAAGVDLRAALREHRATAALEQLGDGIMTGPTGTNVNDLLVIAIGHA